MGVMIPSKGAQATGNDAALPCRARGSPQNAPVRIGIPVLLALAIAAAGCVEKRKPASSQADTKSEPPPASKIIEDYTKNLGTAPKRAAITVDLTAVQKAVNQFQAMEGRLPASIDELVAGRYLPQLPAVPRGMKLHYDPATGAVSVLPE